MVNYANMTVKELYRLPNNTLINQPMGIDIKDVIRDICAQIDGKIVMGLGFILLYWTVRHLIAPFAVKYYEEYHPMLWEGGLKVFYEHAMSFLETLMLGFCYLIMGYYFIQNGISVAGWIWISIIGSLIMLRVIMWAVIKFQKK